MALDVRDIEVEFSTRSFCSLEVWVSNWLSDALVNFSASLVKELAVVTESNIAHAAEVVKGPVSAVGVSF